MSYEEEIFLSLIRAKYGAGKIMPVHDPLTCGIYWESSCLDCVRLWDQNDRQREVPKILQKVLKFKELKLEGKSLR